MKLNLLGRNYKWLHVLLTDNKYRKWCEWEHCLQCLNVWTTLSESIHFGTFG